MGNINYDEILDTWHDKVVKKADKMISDSMYEEFGVGYVHKRSFADGMYMALAMLSREEMKAKKRM